MATFTSTSYGPPWTGIQGTGVTATGIDLRSGPQRYVVAVDPNVIPLGTHLHIFPNPFGDPNIDFVAGDTGGAIKGNRIDFYDWRGRSQQTAWGSRPVQVVPFGQAQLATPAAYPALSAEPGVDLQHDSPVLLRRLNDVLARYHLQGDVISGYRNSGVGGAAGFAGDPHSKGLAADVLVNGQPIADVLGWQTLSDAGLRSGSDPRLQPFYKGGPDPAHVDLMNAAGTDPMGGVTIMGQTAGSSSYPTMGAVQHPAGGSWASQVLGGLLGALTWDPSLPGIGKNPVGPISQGAVTTVGGLLGTISDPRFWLRVLEIVGGLVLVLAGLVLAGRKLAIPIPTR